MSTIKQQRLRLPFYFLVLLLLQSCASNTIEVAQGLNNIRAKAIQDTAITYGTQMGLAVRTQQINQHLAKSSVLLDKIFDFNAVLLPHNVMPPVLTESQQSMHLASHNTVRLANRILQIVKPAHFVSAPPSWRDYLALEYTLPSIPNITLLPRTAEERALWDRSLKLAWTQGIYQANQIFSENLSRLRRDFIGMATYRKLLAKHIISPPYVAKTELGITGDSAELRINDAVLRITKAAELNPDHQQWQPVLQSTDSHSPS